MSRIPSPQNDKRACLCKDGKYSRKCCDGTLQAQGIGNVTMQFSELLLEDGNDLLQENNNNIYIDGK